MALHLGNVMSGLDPGIYSAAVAAAPMVTEWIAGSSPPMTTELEQGSQPSTFVASLS